MTIDDQKIEPKLAETGFYKTVHDVIEIAVSRYNRFMSVEDILVQDKGVAYNAARSSLMSLYYLAVLPHNVNNPGDPEVEGFNTKWKSLNDIYGGEFEKGKEINWYNIGSHASKLIEELSLRFSLMMVYLNTLGITKLRERGENWEDTEIDFYEEQLK